MSETYRDYIIRADGSFGHKEIRQKGSGALPKMLLGSYTSLQEAKKAIDQYLATKVKNNATANSSGRGK